MLHNAGVDGRVVPLEQRRTFTPKAAVAPLGTNGARAVDAASRTDNPTFHRRPAEPDVRAGVHDDRHAWRWSRYAARRVRMLQESLRGLERMPNRARMPENQALLLFSANFAGAPEGSEVGKVRYGSVMGEHGSVMGEQPSSGQVALAHGASRGIGLGIARALTRAGHRVALVARTPEDLEQATTGVTGSGPVWRHVTPEATC